MKLEVSQKESMSKMNLDFCSRLNVDGRLFFGGFPSSSHLQQLKDGGFKYIVDCTTVDEKQKLPMYNAQEYGLIYIHYPILDNFIPTDTRSFLDFIRWLGFLVRHMAPNELMYIHCRGGHGRSGLVLACMICLLYKVHPTDSIRELTRAHLERKILSPRWKKRLCPANEIQRLYLHNLFCPRRIKTF